MALSLSYLDLFVLLAAASLATILAVSLMRRSGTAGDNVAAG